VAIVAPGSRDTKAACAGKIAHAGRLTLLGIGETYPDFVGGLAPALSMEHQPFPDSLRSCHDSWRVMIEAIDLSGRHVAFDWNRV
jgi:hypothetical protein